MRFGRYGLGRAGRRSCEKERPEQWQGHECPGVRWMRLLLLLLLGEQRRRRSAVPTEQQLRGER